jgi:hypothetical protein
MSFLLSLLYPVNRLKVYLSTETSILEQLHLHISIHCTYLQHLQWRWYGKAPLARANTAMGSVWIVGLHLPGETACAAFPHSNSIRVYTLGDGEQDAAASLNQLFAHHILIAACLSNAAISQ